MTEKQNFLNLMTLAGGYGGIKPYICSNKIMSIIL
jgi:hypothetical protein